MMNAIRYSFIFLFILSNTAHAEVWTIQGERVDFAQTNDGVKYAHCKKKPECKALNALKNTRAEAKSSKGGTNPAALLCEGLGGKVLVGTDDLKNENSFCQFSDGSLVSAADLYKAAVR